MDYYELFHKKNIFLLIRSKMEQCERGPQAEEDILLCIGKTAAVNVEYSLILTCKEKQLISRQ